MVDFSRLAYIDLETTGTKPTRDQITEIAIVQTLNGVIVSTWQSLICPNTHIPLMIQKLTGITPEMVADAPTIDEVLPVIIEKLAGHVLVAHNARFDVGFLRNAFKQNHREFKYPVVCTVKLSREMYPNVKRHNLDSIIKRLDLICESRHRAMDDAAILPQIVARMRSDFNEQAVLEAMQSQQRLSSVPPHINPDIFSAMPNEPGVYLFYGETGNLLYVGKSVQIRARVISHFSSDHSHDREMRMAQQVYDIEWVTTAGEFSALVLESELVKSRAPLFNRQLRKQKSLFTIYWENNIDQEISQPSVIDINTLSTQSKKASLNNTYGLFKNRRTALEALRKLKDENKLCGIQLGLEKGKGPCFSYQLKKCKGICCGQESDIAYQIRMQQALAPIKIKGWPYQGAIGIKEYNEKSDISCIHIISHWLYLGKVNDESELADFDFDVTAKLDIDFYKICISQLQKSHALINLQKLMND
ncbi:exonuclease domain-containing protein [Psychromonas sp. 14N.309.X.WAT.B.A12]|uniref:exonuclease domain-containing protein n=1 Tax=Psychromonas sp. 14N.309.X.WAT.B.A12 TaxID=2998322 RepID=UPI0025B1ED30|nr:exonuclease domain-containing protein [Psychromonas sp. 14N.309.X.WAT.B.A12]MDN2661963.1 exonuclease domain-containing protein [Psychromonas sp. 14N.309.X.WAT.B.A12]